MAIVMVIQYFRLRSRCQWDLALLGCYATQTGGYCCFLDCLSLEDETDRFTGTSVTTTLRWVTSQKSEDLNLCLKLSSHFYFWR